MRRSESMQQSSATQSLHLCFWGLRKIVACSHFSSQCLLVPTVFGTVSSLHPTSFLYLYMYNYYPKPALLHPCPHCSSTMRFVINKKQLIWPVLSVCILLLLRIEHQYCDETVYVIRVRSYHFTKIRCSTPSGF